MPGRHGRVADQRGRVGADAGADSGRPGGAERPDLGQAAGHGTGGRGSRGGPVRGNQPRADAHRRGDLGHAQHVQEAQRPAEVVDQRHRGQPDRPGRADLGRPGQLPVSGEVGNAGQHRRRAGQAAEEKVTRDLRAAPYRLLDDRAAVVGVDLGARNDQRFRPPPPACWPRPCTPQRARARRSRLGAVRRLDDAVALGAVPRPGSVLWPGAGPAPGAVPEAVHDPPQRRPPRLAMRPPAATAAAAVATCRHIRGRSRVVTTGSGGRP